MSDNPYEATPVAKDAPIAARSTKEIVARVALTLICGIALGAANFFGGTFLAIGCFNQIGYQPNTVPNLLAVGATLLFFANIVFTPVLALIICGQAIFAPRPLDWLKRNWWQLVFAFAIPFVLFSIMILSGASVA